jgi:hypothetical protein
MALNFSALLTDMGNGIGGFLTAIQEPLVYIIFVLAIVTVVVLIMRKFGQRIGKAF